MFTACLDVFPRNRETNAQFRVLGELSDTAEKKATCFANAQKIKYLSEFRREKGEPEERGRG